MYFRHDLPYQYPAKCDEHMITVKHLRDVPLRPRLGYFPVWKTNLEGPNGPLIRIAGGIPIPTHSFRAMAQFSCAM